MPFSQFFRVQHARRFSVPGVTGRRDVPFGQFCHRFSLTQYLPRPSPLLRVLVAHACPERPCTGSLLLWKDPGRRWPQGPFANSEAVCGERVPDRSRPCREGLRTSTAPSLGWGACTPAGVPALLCLDRSCGCFQGSSAPPPRAPGGPRRPPCGTRLRESRAP